MINCQFLTKTFVLNFWFLEFENLEPRFLTHVWWAGIGPWNDFRCSRWPVVWLEGVGLQLGAMADNFFKSLFGKSSMIDLNFFYNSDILTCPIYFFERPILLLG